MGVPAGRQRRPLTPGRVAYGGCALVILLVLFFGWGPLAIAAGVTGAGTFYVVLLSVMAVVMPGMMVVSVAVTVSRRRRIRQAAASLPEDGGIGTPPGGMGALTAEQAAVAVGREHGLGLPSWVRKGRGSTLVAGRPARSWLARYPGGYAQVVMADPRPRVVCWTDVTEVTFTIERRTILAGQYPSTVTSIRSFAARPFRGPAMPVPGEQDAARLRAAALRIVGERMLPAMTAAYDAGEIVSCGAVRVSQHGIALTGTSVPVPWQEIRSVRLRSVRLSAGRSKVTSTVSLARSGRGLRSRISLSGLPNGLFLPGLLQYAAAQHGIPVSGHPR
jgi:hypothetical protein